MSAGRWQRRPDGSTWGEFGQQDGIGRMNLIGPEQVQQALREVREGRSFCLSLPLDHPRGTSLNPNRFPPIVRPGLRRGEVNFNCDMSVAYEGASDVMCDDLVVLHTQYSTHWDALGHAGARFDADDDGHDEIVYYNGWRGGVEIVGPEASELAGLESLTYLEGAATGTASTSDGGPVDISHLASHGVQSRGVLVDLRDYFEGGQRVVSYDEFASCMSRNDVVVERGDIVLLHTGAGIALHGHDTVGTPVDPGVGLDGEDDEIKQWIRESGVAAIAADNYAVEAFPPRAHSAGEPVLPLHELCLFRLGVHLGELWWLTDLADAMASAGRSRFLLTAPPLRLPKATGSPVTPIATI